MRTHFLHLGRPKMRLGEFQKAIFQGIPWTYNLIFCHLACQKFYFVFVEKALFKVLPGAAKSFSSPWSAQNATWSNSRKLC
jgi:hypothetical protein